MKEKKKCIICEGVFYINKKAPGSTQEIKRPKLAKTCCSKCSKIYNRVTQSFWFKYIAKINNIEKKLKSIERILKGLR